MEIDTIYHYTSFDVLSKILNSKKLRFTQMQSLNDKSEYKYGIQLLKNRIIEYENSNNIINRFDILLLDRFSFSNSLYSISFTENGDDYSFWNSYYVPKNGGVAIGFKNKEIFDSNYICNKCIYGDPYHQMTQERYEWFRSIFDRNNITRLHKNKEYIQITYQTAHLKKSAFKIENEWRAISFLPDKNKQDEFIRNGKRVKCFDQIFNLKSISEIVIGPSDSQLSINSKVKNLLTQYDELNCNLLNSNIPLEL